MVNVPVVCDTCLLLKRVSKHISVLGEDMFQRRYYPVREFTEDDNAQLPHTDRGDIRLQRRINSVWIVRSRGQQIRRLHRYNTTLLRHVRIVRLVMCELLVTAFWASNLKIKMENLF